MLPPPRHEGEFYGWARQALQLMDRDRRRLRGEGDPVEVLDLAELVEGAIPGLGGTNYDGDVVPDNPPPTHHNWFDTFPDAEDLTLPYFGGNGLWTTTAGNLKATASNGINLPLLFRGFSAYTLCTAKVHVDHTTSAFTVGGVCIRASYDGPTANNGYWLQLTRPGGVGTPGVYTLYKIVGGASTTLATGNMVGFLDGDEIGLQGTATQLLVLWNGAQIDAVTESTFTSGSCGVWVSDNTIQFRDFTLTDDRP